jgi:phospholipase/carboxylesterase
MSGGLDDLVHRVRRARGEPQGVIVLFHGRGADERDLSPLLHLLDPDGSFLGVTPRGPLSLPPGGAHWYALGGIPTPDPDTFHATFGRVTRWLSALAEDTGIAPERTVVGGFSQGAVLSYGLALGRGRPRHPALLALSGFIPSVPDFELDLSDRSGLLAAIGHGLSDQVIGVEWSRRARAALEQAGAQVIYGESPIPHSIDPEFVRKLAPRLLHALRVAGS